MAQHMLATTVAPVLLAPSAGPLVGYLFSWPLLGIDPVLGRRGHAWRMSLIGLTRPVHAFLGVAIMSVPPGLRLIAGDWYLRPLPFERAVSQQQLGGAVRLAAGDPVATTAPSP